MKHFIIYSLLFVLISCDHSTHKLRFDINSVNNDRDIIVANRISHIKIIKVGLDTIGSPLWRRIEFIEHYDQSGLLSMMVSPAYMWDRSYSNSIKAHRKPGEGLTIEEINIASTMEATNIPTGEIDSTFYEYDKHNNIVTLRTTNHVTSFKYDAKNNCIERCVDSNYSETRCLYSIYKYDQQGHITYKVDSSGTFSNTRGLKTAIPSKTSHFRYDSKGNISSDGTFNYSYNENGQLLERFTSNESDFFKTVYTYDDSGFKVKETETDQFGTRYRFHYYNDNGLPKETKVLDENNRLKKLTKYEYAHY